MSLDIGATIGDYQIVGVLGAGGMGKVYKVRNVISDRIEAMKVLLPNLDSDRDLADRFVREIKVQASLDHPNIAGLHTAQRAENQLLMIMEYVEGSTIDTLMKNGRIPVREGVNYISQVLSALAYAHARGVIHRDIKPSNMMLTPEGVVKLMDFGIAKMTADHKLTQTGRTVGSLFYMSPEQIRGDTNLDARSDLYSVGISLYEIVTGRRPFAGDSDYSIMAAHLQQAPMPPVQLDPSLPPALNDVILMSIAKDPAQRFQSADAFRNALAAVVSDVGVPAAAAVAASGTALLNTPAVAPTPQPGMSAPPPSPPPATPAASHGHRGLYMLLGSLVTVAILVAVALEYPKWSKTRAQVQETVAVPQTPQQQVQPAPAPVQQPVQTAPVPTPVESAPAQQAPLSNQVQQAPLSQVQQAPARPRREPNTAAAAVQAPPESIRQHQASPQTPAAAVQQPQTAPPAAPSATQPAATPAVDTKAIDELRQRQSLMAVRIGAVKTSMDKLQSEQSRMGLGISQDLVARERRVELFMDQAEGALRDGNIAQATSKLDNAERELEKLEERFGH